MNVNLETIALKEKQINELAEKIKNAKTLIVVSVKSLPSKQFQEIKKSLRNDAVVKITKKNIILRTLEKLGKESTIQNYIKSDFAFVISSMDGYELAGILASKKIPVFAKAGQIANSDIEIKAGATSLVPGPAISELGNLGIKIAVEEGKISIKEPKVVVKEGQEIKESVASLLQKLNIQPFNIGLDPLVIYDIKNEKIYTDIRIDSKEASKELSISEKIAIGFAKRINYYCKETISYFLIKSKIEMEALNNCLISQINKQEGI